MLMALKTISVNEAADRWAEGSTRAIRENLDHPTNNARYNWALDFGAGDIRTLTRTPTGQGNIRLSRHHLKQGKLESTDKVRVVPLPEGGLAILPATREEIEARHRSLTDSPPQTFSESEAPTCRESFEITCAECGERLQSKTPCRIFCDDCKHDRATAQKLEWWKAHGKQTPSYLAKLKHLTTPDPAQMVLSI